MLIGILGALGLLAGRRWVGALGRSTVRRAVVALVPLMLVASACAEPTESEEYL